MQSCIIVDIILLLVNIMNIQCKSLLFKLTRQPLYIDGKEVITPLAIKLCFGTPRQCFNLAYDTGSYITWIPDNSLKDYYTAVFNPSESRTFQTQYADINALHTECSISGYEGIDTVSFSDMNEHISFFFSFAIGQSFYTYYNRNEGNLGLARNYSQQLDFDSSTNRPLRFSFIEFLYGANLIEKKVFWHKYFNEDTGILVFGEEPKMEEDEHAFQCKCVNNDDRLINDFWNCQITSYTLDNIEITVDDHYAIFSTGEQYIIAPYQIGYKILDTYKSYNDAQCVISIENGYYELRCPYFNYMNLPSLKLAFEEYTMVLTPHMLFSQHGPFLHFQIKVADDGQSYWTIGSPALFNIGMVFDYENNSISFISREQKPTSYYMMKSLMLIIGIGGALLLFYAFQLFLNYRKERKLCQAVAEARRGFDIDDFKYNKSLINK